MALTNLKFEIRYDHIRKEVRKEFVEGYLELPSENLDLATSYHVHCRDAAVYLSILYKTLSQSTVVEFTSDEPVSQKPRRSATPT